MGRRIKEGLDVTNGSNDNYRDLVADSNARITETDVSFDDDIGEDWWIKTERSVYGIDPDGTHSSSSTPVLVSKTLDRLTGFATNVVAESYIYDAHNSESNKTVRSTEINRLSKKRLEKVNYSDSSTIETTTYGNGLPIKTVSAQNVTTKTYFDAWGRIDKTSDRTGDHVITYEAGTTLLTKINNPSNNDPEFDYDSAGRRDEVKRPKVGTNYVTAYTEFDKLGRVVKQWGSAANPVEYLYDDENSSQTIKYGDLWKQKTYRAGSGWDDESGPTSTGTADVTEYDYDVATGLLAKTITKDPTDPEEEDTHEVRFTYTDRGQLRTKRWAREVVAGGTEDHPYIFYVYDTATGELSNKYYKKTNGEDPATYPLTPLNDANEGTTNVSFFYTRLGTLKSVTDYTGTRNFTYRTSDFQLDQEKLGAGYGTNKMITRSYRPTGGNGAFVGKYAGVKFGLTTEDDRYLETTHGFESGTGRLSGLGYYRAASSKFDFQFLYKANSNLISKVYTEVENEDEEMEDVFAINRDWEDDRNLLEKSEINWYTTDKSINYYKYDWLGRRTEEFQRGEVYDIYQEEDSSGVDGIMIQYGYSDRSELTSAISYLDANSGGSFVVGSADDTEVFGRSFQYSYDNQGNRASTDGTTVNDRDSDYTSNALNQYSSRDIPGYIDIGVKAADTATVTVTDETPSPDVNYSTSQQGEYFYAELDNDGATGGYVNSSGGLLRTISISDGTTLVEGKEYLKEDDEDFTYYDDGMLKYDGSWTHVYDAENRLMWHRTTLVAGDEPDPIVGMSFRYDYLGRRVLKMVYHWNGSSWVWQSNRKYVYDGFNLIAETDWSGNIKRTYVWGLDESGSLQGAGGVGGLLMIRDEATAKEYFVMNDGKGNVNGILNAETGSLVAAYEYGPFGEPLRASGTFADDNNFRFSTKFTDPESGLVYFGLRHYNPSMGRFISRDPIGEAGGLNLYGFVGNDPVNRWDYLGLNPNLEHPFTGSDGRRYCYEDGRRKMVEIRTSLNSSRWEYVNVWTYAGTNQSPYLSVTAGLGEPGVDDEYDMQLAAEGSEPDSLTQKDKEKDKNDCYDFVDRLVRISESNNSIHKGPDWLQAIQVGRDIGDAFVPKESEVHGLVGNPLEHGIIWFDQQRYEPSRATGAWQTTVGFRDVLTMGGQGRDMYRHVAAGASLKLNLLSPVVFAGDARDIWQGLTDGRRFWDGGPGGWGQRIAEVAGNHAGLNVGEHIGRFMAERIDAADLREKLRNELCK